MILFVVDIIKKFRSKQKERMSKFKGTRSNSRKDPLQGQDKVMDKFCIAMDNYFTLPKVIKCLRELGVGVVGTARFRRNWPPQFLKDVKQTDVTFNEFHYCFFENTLLARWIHRRQDHCPSTLQEVCFRKNNNEIH